MVDRVEVGLAIKEVAADSLAEELELRPGDAIEALNGQPVRDPIDFRFNFGEENIELRVRRGEELLVYEIEKDPDDDLGVTFEDMPILKCDNKCVFCFLHQMPKKLRKTLYYQDDDYRLSFLHGAYVTLTNLSEEEFDRIVDQRLSPLYVSVHATDPDIRGRLLGRTGPVDVLERLDFLISKGILIHTQVVYCPGLNDGVHLDKTITDLDARYPDVVSLGVVPLGLTQFRKNLPDLAPVTREGCREVLAQIHAHQDRFLDEFGRRFVYAGDEMYLQSEQETPSSDRYDGFPLIENGIGMVRRFLDDFETGLEGFRASMPTGKVSLVTGMLGKRFVGPMAARLNRLPGLSVDVIPVRNDFLGHGITVSGLLSGEDILKTLRNAALESDRVILPPNCVNHEGFFLDDLCPDDLSQAVGRPVQIGTYSLIDSILMPGDRSPSVSGSSVDHPYIASHQNP